MTTPEIPPPRSREPRGPRRRLQPRRLLAALFAAALPAAVLVAFGSGAAETTDGGREPDHPRTPRSVETEGRTGTPRAAPSAGAGTNEDPDRDFISGRAGFAVAFRDIVTPYATFLLTALPNERVVIRAIPGVEPELPAGLPPEGSPGAASFDLRASAGEVRPAGPARWEWRAPGRPGYHTLVVRRRGERDSVVLNAAVLVPFHRLRDGKLDGYRLGRFPAEPYRGLPQYERPRGFLPLRSAHEGVRVSPHFTLDQFPAKGPAGWPKYLVLEERLLLKLEWLLEEAVRAGVPVTTFRVLSGFRSPWYNAGIGRPKYSRHIYGDAADVYVDEDADGRMDDLNGDGRSDVRDADVLYRIVEAMDAAPETRHFLGGLGKYRVTPSHGPFIHVDTRLYRARW